MFYLYRVGARSIKIIAQQVFVGISDYQVSKNRGVGITINEGTTASLTLLIPFDKVEDVIVRLRKAKEQYDKNKDVGPVILGQLDS